MTEGIREKIEEFKHENGNNNFTNKEMLMYLIKRLDNLPCEEHLGIIYTMQNDVEHNKRMFKTWRWIAGILLTTILALIGFIQTT